jgi:putative flippase GtrA
MSLIVPAIRFALVGIIVTLVHVVVAIGLIEGMQMLPGAANGVAFALANLVSYVANTKWSFQTRLGLDTWKRFVIVSAAAWVLTVAITWGIDRAGGHYLLGISIVVTLVPALSFAAHRWFTYRQSGAT